jgi:hypothetical protein
LYLKDTSNNWHYKSLFTDIKFVLRSVLELWKRIKGMCLASYLWLWVNLVAIFDSNLIKFAYLCCD